MGQTEYFGTNIICKQNSSVCDTSSQPRFKTAHSFEVLFSSQSPNFSKTYFGFKRAMWRKPIYKNERNSW